MTQFVRLTRALEGRSVFINSDRVDLIEENDIGGTVLTLGQIYKVAVKEDVERVRKLLTGETA